MPADAPESAAQAQDKTSLHAQLLQAKQHRKDRIVEELADQRLGDMPSAGAGGRAAGPHTVSSEPEGGRYAQNQATSSGTMAGMDDSRAAGAQAAAPQAEPQVYAANAPPPPPAAAPPPGYMQNSSPQRVPASADSDGTNTGSSLISTMQEELRQGRCTEAHGVLQRLEQSFPSLAGLAELRAQWQRTCQTQNALPMQQQAPESQAPPKMLQNNEQNYAPAPPMERSSLPQPVASKSAPMRAKKAAPAKAKAAAADAAAK
jgi:hypothetical protein